jgi:hypothetical protein
MLTWYTRNWYYVGAVLFAALAFWMIFWGSGSVDRQSAILIASLMALFCHQFEEYRLPGGASIIINIATYGEKKHYDRYPGNTLSIVIVNTVAWFVYAAAILFPQAIWLGLATMFFGFFQVLGHGVQMNIRTRGWYNPGLVTAVLLHLPIGICYIVHITQHGLGSGWDYLWGALGLVAIFALTVIAPVQGLKDRSTRWVISEEEMNRFHMLDKLTARGVI